MKTTLCIASVLTVSLSLFAADKPPENAQSQRGRQLFAKSARGIACGTCHSMGGVGTAIAPDLTTMATYAPPRGLVATMHMTMTEHVLLVKTSAGDFPGLLKGKDGDKSTYWDMSQTPPVIREFTTKQILSAERDQKWKHPPATTEYTNSELADMVAFLRYAATGSIKEIKASDIE
jgi:Cytochrome c